MDWDWFIGLKNFLVTLWSTDGHTIIVSVITTVIVAIATVIVIDTISAIKTFTRKQLVERIQQRCSMVVKWWRERTERKYWKDFGPECQLLSKGKLEITQTPNGYNLALPITLSYKSGDNYNVTLINCGVIRVKVNSLKLPDGRTPAPHVLGNKTAPETFELEPNGPAVEVNFVLVEERLKFRPSLGTKVCCHWISLGHITIHGPTVPGGMIERQVQLLDPFEVQVDKSRIEPLTSHKGGSQT